LPTPTPIFGANCIAPIYWAAERLHETEPGVYRATPPETWKGYWVGYFIELFFEADTAINYKYQFTTPGYAWPNTLPFPDCSEKTCVGRLL
jgi:hypothetical protein